MDCVQNKRVEVAQPPEGLGVLYSDVFTPGCVAFLAELVSHFQTSVAELLRVRQFKRLELEGSNELPTFPNIHTNEDWKIAPLPPRLQCQHLGLGDVSPSNPIHFITSLNSHVHGIQVDFDDGHCPTWANTIAGLHNVVAFVNGTFHPHKVPSLEKAPVLLLRPRAWNMPEHNIFVDGKTAPGPLIDFGVLIYHVGQSLVEKGVGPYFYLSKIERATESKLWNEIFTWAEDKLGLHHGVIKASVLIENILACFEAEDILYEMREHSFGLNCGVWDYCASVISKFGHRKDFILPDRNKYCTMDEHFMKSYLSHVVQTCHKHGAPVICGMAAMTVTHSDIDKRAEITRRVCEGKRKEIEAGVDGFLVYDVKLIPPLSALWAGRPPNQIESELNRKHKITTVDLLQMPEGHVTLVGLKHNVRVGIQFVYSWLRGGDGNFILEGAVEDSATAEIARSQIWQWIYHQVPLDGDDRRIVTKRLVNHYVDELHKFARMALDSSPTQDMYLKQSCQVFMEIVTAPEFPEFITTYLYNHSYFRAAHDF